METNDRLLYRISLLLLMAGVIVFAHHRPKNHAQPGLHGIRAPAVAPAEIQSGEAKAAPPVEPPPLPPEGIELTLSEF